MFVENASFQAKSTSRHWHWLESRGGQPTLRHQVQPTNQRRPGCDGWCSKKHLLSACASGATSFPGGHCGVGLPWRLGSCAVVCQRAKPHVLAEQNGEGSLDFGMDCVCFKLIEKTQFKKLFITSQAIEFDMLDDFLYIDDLSVC